MRDLLWRVTVELGTLYLMIQTSQEHSCFSGKYNIQINPPLLMQFSFSKFILSKQEESSSIRVWNRQLSAYFLSKFKQEDVIFLTDCHLI